MAERRKDRKGRVLKEGESQRKDGSYDFRWRTSDERKSRRYKETRAMVSGRTLRM